MSAAKETEAISNVTDPQELIITRINTKHAEVVGYAGKQIDLAIEIGEELNGVKSQVKHGKWFPWVKANLSFGDRQASKYMYMATNVSILANRNPSSDLNSIHDACAYIRAMKKDGVWPPKEPEPRTPVAKKSDAPVGRGAETLTQEALDELKRELDERTAALDERERKLNVKPKSLKQLMDMEDMKLILGILKRAPEGQEEQYAQGHAAFEAAIQ